MQTEIDVGERDGARGSAVGRGRIGSARVFAETFVRIALQNALPNGKKSGLYIIVGFKKKHPDLFKEDLSSLLGLLAEG